MAVLVTSRINIYKAIPSDLFSSSLLFKYSAKSNLKKLIKIPLSNKNRWKQHEACKPNMHKTLLESISAFLIYANIITELL